MNSLNCKNIPIFGIQTNPKSAKLNDQEKIICEVQLGCKDNPVVSQIGELPFDVLLQ